MREWTDDDDRARAVHDLRLLMRRHMGVNTDGLTDDEVVLIFQRRVSKFADAMQPILARLRAAGVIDDDADTWTGKREP